MEESPSYKLRERFIPESQLRDAIKTILAEMLGVNNVIQSSRQWYDTELAYSLLGLNSVKQLREMVRSGTLRIGHEVRDVRSPDSLVPRYQFHIEKCEQQLALPPEKREARRTEVSGKERASRKYGKIA
ncbi:MAG: hypothetical protein KME54_26445 [Tolypothrix brevis GSE-NOS-MK-07-07A]|jgi:hypothetical protein|nr:hypothetical protein [Tolypothrix brevis GSE-NOS-MK-07-07A]